jgi:CubicO group peptidase (beta-lactamase class C family)
MVLYISLFVLIMLNFVAWSESQGKDIFRVVNNRHKTPSLQYILFDTDSTIYSFHKGSQNIETGSQVNNNTTYPAYSITKTFTAVAVMQLHQQGRINIDDNIQKYLNYHFSDTITIRQLLCHQSGLANPIPLKWIHLKKEHDSFSYQSFIDSIINAHLKLKRPPGTKFAYSNINYLVLGRLIEIVSGQDYRDYILESITTYLPVSGGIGFEIPDSNHAFGYHPKRSISSLILGFLLDKKKFMYKTNSAWHGFHQLYPNGLAYGGIIANKIALTSFCREMFREDCKLLSRETRNLMFEEQETLNGRKTGMALGWFTGKLNNQPYYCHAGGGGGYYCEIRIYPKLKTGSVIMTNSTGMSDARILDHIDVNFIKELGND